MSIRQSDAVMLAINEFYGEPNGVVELTSEQFNNVIDFLYKGFKSDEISLNSAKYDTDKKIMGYCKALLKNNLKKDKRLNGGTKYVPKNPGSGGKRDDQLKALNQILKQLDPKDENVQVIEAEIAKREQEIAAERAKKVEINYSVLSPELRAMFGK